MWVAGVGRVIDVLGVMNGRGLNRFGAGAGSYIGRQSRAGTLVGVSGRMPSGGKTAGSFLPDGVLVGSAVTSRSPDGVGVVVSGYGC